MNLGEANSFITDIAQKTVRERLAEVLLFLVNDFGLDNQQLSQYISYPRRACKYCWNRNRISNQVFSEFKSDKLVELNGRKIKILNIKGLEKISNVFN